MIDRYTIHKRKNTGGEVAHGSPPDSNVAVPVRNRRGGATPPPPQTVQTLSIPIIGGFPPGTVQCYTLASQSGQSITILKLIRKTFSSFEYLYV
jgi:hypothetical protein